MIVRAAHPSDLPGLIALAPLGHAPLVEHAFAASAAGTNRMLVAELQGELVGQVWLDLERRRDERVAIIWALRVAAAHQSRRIGAALLIAVERLAARLGFQHVEAGVSGGTPSLCAMYERRGYRRAGNRVEYQRWRSPTGAAESARFEQSLWEKEVLPMRQPKLGIRWTIGDVRRRGFVALRLSIAGAYRLFGDEACYVVCVNSIDVARARALTGQVPAAVVWERAPTEAPEWLRASLGPTMADGVAWKLLPLRRFPDLLELSLDNDVVFWSIPPAMRTWLDSGDRCLLAEDVHPAFGQFSAHCGEQALNTGIRGLPPGFDLEERLRRLLSDKPLLLESELDEQGLQVAAIRPEDPLVVAASDVTICSPFPPHVAELGRHGAHFVGLNTQRLPFRSYAGRPAEQVRAEHFDERLPQLLARLAAPL